MSTVTVHVLFKPLLVVAVMAAVPALFAVIRPLVSTDTIASLSLVHVIVLLSVVSTGIIVAVNIEVLPLSNCNVLGVTDTPTIGFVGVPVFVT